MCSSRVPAWGGHDFVSYNIRLLFPSGRIRPVVALCIWALAHKDCNLVEEVLSLIGSSSFTRTPIPPGIIREGYNLKPLHNYHQPRSTIIITYKDTFQQLFEYRSCQSNSYDYHFIS